ncbi:MAG: Asp-tRNA(Asn)/Glu-tRNA(Gln) amidotransferase subunit GatA [Candidatus Zhuqueibacterota bacterium]
MKMRKKSLKKAKKKGKANRSYPLNHAKCTFTATPNFQPNTPYLNRVEHYLNRINEGRDLNAFISIFGQEAKDKARELDHRNAVSDASLPVGMVIAVKDNIHIAGHRTTCGSKMLAHFVSPYYATVIEKLDAAGAIFIGKTNMDEFAMGSSNETSCFGPVKNPHDVTRVPGGSSGGSAAAVAAGMARAALGSDTGGSVRQPAALCGVVGLKPTYGRISRYGLVAFASSLDQIGVITQTIADNAMILQTIAGHDPRDATSADAPVPDYPEQCRVQAEGMTIGIPVEFFGPGIQADVRVCVQRCAAKLHDFGLRPMEISLPQSCHAIATYYIIATAEASSNLARFDGARFGHRSRDARTLDDMYVRSRTEGFGDEVKRRIMLGTFVLSSGYYEAYYRRAQNARTLIKRDFDAAFRRCDCILTPTSPSTAFQLGEKMNDPLAMYLSDIFTVSANLAGIPALSLPCGFDSNGLPIGVQLMAPPFGESTLYRIGQIIEQICQS